VLAEGNLDVIQSHQAGVRQVVATAGTALTEQHLKALSKFTGDIRLSFDADRAGINATERAIPIASKVGVSLSVISIPSGKDPDELIKQDPGAWQETIQKNQYALDWLIDRYKHELDLGSAEGKRKFSDILLPVVRQLQDSVEKDHYLQELAKIIGVSKEALVDKYQKTTKAPPKRPQKTVTPQQVDKQTAEYLKRQNRLLALTLMQPSVRHYLNDVEPEMLPEEQARTLLVFLKKNPNFTGREPEPAAELREISDYAKILTVAYEELYQDLEGPNLQTEAAIQQAGLIKYYVQMQKHETAKMLASADDDQRRALLERDIQLNQLLGKIK
jgi:DNA primase